jgi:hypothetical protein
VSIFFRLQKHFRVLKRPKARYKKSSKTTEKETKKTEGEKNTFFCHEPRWTFWGGKYFRFFLTPLVTNKRRKRDKINQGKDPKKIGWWVDGSGIQQMHGGVRRLFFGGPSWPMGHAVPPYQNPKPKANKTRGSEIA